MKKVLSIVLSIAMVLCMMPAMAFAGTASAAADTAYSDVVGTPCEGAVNVLHALGVVDGYTDGTYKPEQVVTRAEMAKLIVTALGVDKYATATTSKFTDMGAASWAIPYVEYAANLNIVNGYGYGLFGPNDTVTYEQAVTMIVRALGYTDECKEMNGSWPAIYVQKAIALGIFEDVVNGGSAGADRGDVAIMLYNALTVANVYADGDGQTLAKSGGTTTTYKNEEIKGVTWLGILNKDGDLKYKIVDNTVLDKAVYNVSSYFGALAMVYTDKDGDVIAVGDIKTEAITGTFNGDRDEFTSNGTVYKIASDAFGGNNVKEVGNVYNSTTGIFNSSSDNAKPVLLTNGDISELSSTADLFQNKTYTLAAKISGKTISYVASVSEWNPFDAALAEESDISSISVNHKLFGKEFDEDDNGDIDYTSFSLTGVDSLDDIEEDNVLYAYVSNDGTIRKVEVGTETVEGTYDSFTQSSAIRNTGNKNWGKDGTIVIDGKSYKTSTTPTEASDDVTSWTRADDDDSVEIGDSVIARLTASGKVFKLELSEAASSAYALVLDYAYNTIGNEEITNDQSLNGDDSMIRVMGGDGNVSTLAFKNNAVVYKENKAGKAVTESAVSLSVGDIITYSLNSSNKIKSVTIKGDSSIECATTSSIDAGDAFNNGLSDASEDITAKGYYKGVQIADNATLFAVDKLSGDYARGYTTTGAVTQLKPDFYIDEDDVSVVALSAILDSEDVGNFATYTKNNRYTAMVINGNATSSNDLFGVITSWTALGSDDPSGCDYKLSMIVNGETKDYYYDGNLSTAQFDKTKLYRLDMNASGNIGELYSAESGSWKATYLGYRTADESGIAFKNNAVVTDAGKTVAVDSDCIYLKLNGDGVYQVKTISDIKAADAGKVAVFIDTDTDSDKDGVADVVLLSGGSNGTAIADKNGEKPFTVNAATVSGGEVNGITANASTTATSALPYGKVTYKVNLTGTATTTGAVKVTATVTDGEVVGNESQSIDITSGAAINKVLEFVIRSTSTGAFDIDFKLE